ncbi:MAG: sugar phosphate nucleotidyltransferase [Methanocellales archaeon]|nr:sugar phosphate nucleotidyltransferase [Methanocellales archaeon]MDD3291887.1 sugar phosphate nucleotidyltransferase [Methanocellales archaeon]MDD5235530.1 sugar phosphate nucleotidyltransferase [Methanocellales archaeon]MDD5485149.1 sugar phosphate nucleotidyltransferase [Methanocellales archaeon]
MIGMVLCGGHGKRLRPFTDEIPKSLIEIKEGYTILDNQLLGFLSAGIDHVVLLTGYLSEKIMERYGSEYKGVKIDYIVEDEPLGTLNAIKMGLASVEDDVTIMNGDVIADLNLKKMITLFQNSDFIATMFVTKMRSPYGVVVLGEDSIKSFREKPFLEHYINGGIYCFKKDCSSCFDNFEGGDIEKTVFPMLADSGKLGYYKEDGLFWSSIDTTKDIEEIKKEYAHREDKPWGYEKILISTDKYLTKELFLKEAYRTSHHYHERKDETMFIMSGSGYIEFEDGKKRFGRNDTIRIKPNTPHTIVALENTLIHEVSTPDLEDTIRLKDFYKR